MPGLMMLDGVASRRVTVPARVPGRSWPVEVLVSGLFAAFAVMALAGLGAAERFLFPVAAAGLAWRMLVRGQAENYLAFVFWLFLLTPWLRRLVDLHAGFTQVNVLLLAPYAAGVLSAGPVIVRLKNAPFAFSSLFAMVFACVAYGLILAGLYGHMLAAAYDSVRWTVPPLLGLFIAVQPERRAGLQRAVIRTMIVALTVTGAYGIVQYVIAPSWDVMWMKESALVSIGLPEPYLIRVFSTMNSPASFASWLTAGLLWIVPAAGAVRLPAVALGVIALLLTVVRTSWLGLVVGFVFLVVFGASARARFSILVGVVCLPLVLLGFAQIPQGAEMINSRFSSFSDVQNDGSYLDRAAEYSDFFYKELPDAPFGVGLGSSGSVSGYGNSGPVRMVDGAVMDVGGSLGILGGGMYLLTVVLIGGICFVRSLGSRDTFISSCAGIVVSLTLTLLSGTVTVGEVGVLFWVGAGFCLAPMVRAPAPLARWRGVLPAA